MINKKPYNDDVQGDMVKFYNSLSEKDRRRYAGIEAIKLGHGGILYIATLFGCDEKTVAKGIKEVADNDFKQQTVRAHGGGRKSKIAKDTQIHTVFLEILKAATNDGDYHLTNLTKSEIKRQMEAKGIKVSRNIVAKLMYINNIMQGEPQE